jgi:hypothetical protein
MTTCNELRAAVSMPHATSTSRIAVSVFHLKFNLQFQVWEVLSMACAGSVSGKLRGKVASVVACSGASCRLDRLVFPSEQTAGLCN